MLLFEKYLVEPGKYLLFRLLKKTHTLTEHILKVIFAEIQVVLGPFL